MDFTPTLGFHMGVVYMLQMHQPLVCSTFAQCLCRALLLGLKNCRAVLAEIQHTGTCRLEASPCLLILMQSTDAAGDKVQGLLPRPAAETGSSL